MDLATGEASSFLTLFFSWYTLEFTGTVTVMLTVTRALFNILKTGVLPIQLILVLTLS